MIEPHEFQPITLHLGYGPDRETDWCAYLQDGLTEHSTAEDFCGQLKDNPIHVKEEEPSDWRAASGR